MSTSTWRSKAPSWLRRKKYKEAVGFLTPLKDFPEFKPENKFQLAAVQLKLHVHTVASHKNHPAVELIADLCRNSAYPVFEALRKEKPSRRKTSSRSASAWPSEAGKSAASASTLLEHIAEKFPRNKIGKSAKNKLKLAGV